MAFTKLKEAVTTTPILHPSVLGESFELMHDAIDYAVGIVLGQRIDKKPHMINYASHTLNQAQVNYTVTKKELLAVVSIFEKFRLHLIGSRVIVLTEHAALKHLMEKNDAKPRPIRWIMLL